MNKISLDMVTSWKVLVPAIIIAVVAMMAATFVAKSNADYICTRIIGDESACTIDEWGAWADVGNGDPETGATAGTMYEVVQERLGTGTKMLSRVIEYLSGRTTCTQDYSQESLGNVWTKSWSGFHGGKTFTTSAVCQIEESRTVVRTVPSLDDPECPYVGAPGCPDDIIDGEVVVVETTGAIITGGDEIQFDGIDAMNTFRRTMIEANIALVPALVGHYGDTTEVRWGTREMTTCRVDGDNGDQWLPVTEEVRDNEGNVVQAVDVRTAGRETTGAITGRTVYTLTCTTFEGDTVTEQAVVSRVPVVNEE